MAKTFQLSTDIICRKKTLPMFFFCFSVAKIIDKCIYLHDVLVNNQTILLLQGKITHFNNKINKKI